MKQLVLIICLLLLPGLALAGDSLQAGADNQSNSMDGPVTYSRLNGFDGTYWDRILATGGALVTTLLSIIVDDAAFTPGTTSVNMAGFEFDDTTPDSVNEGDGGAARMSANRNQYVQIRDNSTEVSANVSATGELSCDITTATGLALNAGAAGATVVRTVTATDSPDVVDLAALEALAITIDADTGALVVDLAAIEVDIAALEVLSTAANVDLAAMEALLITIDADTGAMATDLAAIELLNTDIETNTDSLAVVGGGAEATAVRVTLANDSTGLISVDDNGAALTVDNAGTFAVQSTLQAGTAIAGKVYITDGTEDVSVNASNELEVTLSSGVGGFSMNAGAVDATTQRVQLSNDNMTTLSVLGAHIGVDNGAAPSAVAVSGGIYETTPGTLGNGDAGTFRVDSHGSQKIVLQDGAGNDRAANVDASNNLQVDIAASSATVSVDDNASSLTVDNAALSVVGGGAEATALRCTIANDSTGLISVDDNSSTLSVDDGAGALTVDNAGTFAVQVDGDALTALQLIDDVVYADDANTFSVGSSKGTALMCLADASSTDSVDEGDIGAARMSLDRAIAVKNEPMTIDADTATDCVAIPTGADTEHTLSTVSDDFLVSCIGNTGYIECGSTGMNTTTSVGGFAFAIPDGAFVRMSISEAICGVIGTSAAGFCCFNPLVP